MLLDRTRKLKMSFISFLGKAIVYILVNPERAYMTAVTRMKILTPISLGLLTLMR